MPIPHIPPRLHTHRRLAPPTPGTFTTLSSWPIQLGLWVMMMATLSGCASNEQSRRERLENYIPPGRSDMRVLELELKGINAVEEAELLDGLATQEDPGWRASSAVKWVPVLGAEKEYYNELEWDRDIERIQTYYKARGYFDAVVKDTALSRAKDGEGIKIRATVYEGRPTKIETVRLLGLEGEEIEDLEEDKILDRLKVKKGTIFNQDVYEQSKRQLKLLLSSRSYAYAKVDARALVHPKDYRADIVFFVDPGPKATFGSVSVRGLDKVKRTHINDAIAFEKGTSYSSEELQTTQENIYDLGVFSMVNVQPAFELQEEEDEDSGAKRNPEVNVIGDTEVGDTEAGQDVVTSDGGAFVKDQDIGALGISALIDEVQEDARRRTELDPVVDIVIRVKEAKNWSVRVGAGFGINSTRQDVHTALNFSSRNFLGTLGKLEQFNTIGYAITPGFLQFGSGSVFNTDDVGNQGVYLQALLRYQQPQFLERLTTGFLRGSFTRDIQENYISLIPSASVGLRRQLYWRELTLEISYNVLFTSYTSFDPQFGRELRNQGLNPNQDNPSLLLEFLEQRLIYDIRDSPLNPTKGFRVQLGFQEATDYILGGDAAYFRPRIQFDGYLPYKLFTKWITALRVSLASVYNLNDPSDGVSGASDVPLQSRLFGGGKGSIRSFSTRYLGYFTKDRNDPGPIGTITLLDTSIEQRFRLVRNLLGVGDFWGAAYLDVASFSNRQYLFDTDANARSTISTQELLDTLIYGLGGAVYWITPIGPVRFDLAFTLTDISEDPRFGADPNVQDDPSTPVNESFREQQAARAVQDKIQGYDFYIGIGHSF